MGTPHRSRHDRTHADVPFLTRVSERRSRRATTAAGLVALAFILGAPSAYLALSQQHYIAEATLSIAGGGSMGPAARRNTTAPAGQAWINLLRSYTVLDAVVVEERLVPSLSGAVGDADREQAVRAAAEQLSRRLKTTMDPDATILHLELIGPDADATRKTLDALTRRYVDVATELKLRKVQEPLIILEEQLAMTEESLKEAEREFNAFHRSTILDPEDDATTAERAARQALSSVEETRVMRQVQTTSENYSHLRSRVERARLDAASVTPDVRVVEAATITGHTRRRR